VICTSIKIPIHYIRLGRWILK